MRITGAVKICLTDIRPISTERSPGCIMPKLEISHARICIPTLINISRRLVHLGVFARLRFWGNRAVVKPLNPWRAREILKEK